MRQYQILNYQYVVKALIFSTLLLTLMSSVNSNGFYDANERDHIFGQGNKQISDINLLLPISHCQDCRKVVHNISAINGCFQWEVSHPNLIDFQPFQAKSNPECANIAQLSAVSNKPSKSLIWISARDKHGFRFEWNIEQGTDIVKIVTMKEASHKQSELKREMEFSKLHSDVLFLKGLKTGTAQLSVKLMEPGYESVEPVYVTLTITEPFVIIPQKTVYLLPTSKYQFQLAKVSLKNNDMQFYLISLPNKQYQWNIDSEEKADIGEDGLFLSKDQEGFVNIVVVDQYIANNTAEGSVKIVHPSLLDVEIADVTHHMLSADTFLVDDLKNPYSQQLGIKEWDNNWILIDGNYYLLKIFLFDRDKHPIHLTENLIFNNILDSNHFDLIKYNQINSELIVRAKVATAKDEKLQIVSILSEIKSMTPYYKYQIDQNRLRSEKEVRITLPVSIIHPTDLVLLPLIKNQDETRNGELWQLKGEGGSGFYQWSILDQNVASISGSGLIRSKEIGITKIIVKDNLNPRNMKTIFVEVAPVFSLTWLEDHIEILKNQEEAQLSAIALDQKGRKFTNCTSVSTQFELKGEGILQALPTNNSYESIVKYVQDNKQLMFLKQYFDENPQSLTIDQAKFNPEISNERQNLLLHNNFGICQQQKVIGIIEGLGRVKSYFSNYVSSTQSRLIESNYAEIASYQKLKTILPSYSNFFQDLYSKNQITQEEQNFSKLFSENTFDIAFGSSALWVVQGGTNFWKDIPEKYQIIETHDFEFGDEQFLTKNALKFENIHEQATLFKFALSCQYPGDNKKLQKSHKYIVQLRQQNIQSRHLLRPATHYIDIKIQCEIPKDLKIYWAQEDKNLIPSLYQNLPRHKIISSEKNHFVLVNSQHFVRSLIFDNTNQVFYNHSSILIDYQSSDSKMLQVHQLKSNYDDQVREGIFDKRRIEIFNITGTVYLNAQGTGYIKRYLRNDKGYSFSFGSSQSLDTESMNLDYQIKDQMRIEIVENVDIQPKFKSIYLAKDNSFKFKILHGSGHFSVSVNNSDLADRHHIEGDRFITIYPKKAGPIEIKVEDIEIPDAEVAIAELLISDIYRLELDAPGTLIEQDSQMDMLVTAIDNYNTPFDDDQYPYMKFHIEIEITQQRERGLVAIQNAVNNRIFHAKGQEPGLYQVTAISHKSMQADNYYRSKEDNIYSRIVSEVLKIEVFPLLQIQPSTLLLTPLMRYTLQIVGGPSRSASSQSYHGGSVEIKFDIENKTVANVDVFREVTGQDVGDTKLYYEIIQLKSGSSGLEKRSIISKKTIPIRVRLVTDIEIPYNNQRTVYSGSMIKLIGILKYHQEIFTHGIAPISYSWNCSNPNILSLNIPSKQSNVLTQTSLMVNKKIRDNEQNQNDAFFLTQFNSSTIYSVGGKQGEALVTLLLAIEYPQRYKYDKNWFTSKIYVRVNEKLTVDVPEFIHNQEKSTHLYLMPPNTYSKIETNRRTRIRLGYSQQSVYDYSTNSYQYKDSSTQIIQLVNDEGIRTFDKYGKVTVIIEENQAFSDQVVMLNVLITDIYNLACKDAYQALSFPLGSSMNIPIKFQNDHAHSFANNIEGIEVGIELSHPRVVSASLDYYNQTIVMRAEGSGECNVIVYLVKHPHIFDIYRVRVSSVVKPYSPVNLHVGGQVTFKIMDQSSADYSSGKSTDEQQYSKSQSPSSAVWSSNNPSVLDINQASGEARGLSEGRAEVLLSNHISAASIAQVSRVKHAEIDEQSRRNLVINTDEQTRDLRIRMKLYLHDQIEELMPTVQFDGITLIRQNVGIQCESDTPSLVEAKGEINDLEGFFCVLNYVGGSSSSRVIPKSAKITVTVYAPNPNSPSDLKQALYREQILNFEIPFISKIKVESYYRNGVSMNKDHRTATVKIFSNTHFNIHTENQKEADQGYDLVKFKVNKTSEESTEYFLTITVPREITHDFTTNLVLTHPQTGVKTTIPVIFQGREGSTSQYKYASKDEGEGILSGFTKMFASSEQHKQPVKRDERASSEKESTLGIFSTILIVSLVTVITLFFLINVFNVDPIQMLRDIFDGRNPFSNQRRQPAQRRGGPFNQPSSYERNSYAGASGRFGGAQIRSSNIQRDLFHDKSQSFMKQSPSNYSPGFSQGYRQQPGAVPLDRVQYSASSNLRDRTIYGSSGK